MDLATLETFARYLFAHVVAMPRDRMLAREMPGTETGNTLELLATFQRQALERFIAREIRGEKVEVVCGQPKA